MTIITNGMGAIIKAVAKKKPAKKKPAKTSVAGNQLLNKLAEIVNRPVKKETFKIKKK